MVISQHEPWPLPPVPGPTRPPVAGTLSTSDGAVAQMSQLAAVLSHDMRIPLSSIIAGLEMLDEALGEDRDPAVAVLLDRTSKAAARMLLMLEHNLDGHPTAVATSPERVDVDLEKVAHDLARDSAPLLERVGATLEVGRLPTVRAQPDEMYCVLQNLIVNALKFTLPGARSRVSISATQFPYGWRISVRDNGIGIPPEHRMDVFTLFTRATSEFEGHGIGLGAVARTVHALGGRVGADEAPGGGADVWFELPTSFDE